MSAAAYRNLNVDKLLGKGAHLVAEAERVVAGLLGRKGKVALALLFARHDDLVVRGRDFVVDIERATGLDLIIALASVSRLSIVRL